jgi:hypothetical protein
MQSDRTARSFRAFDPDGSAGTVLGGSPRSATKRRKGNMNIAQASRYAAMALALAAAVALPTGPVAAQNPTVQQIIPDAATETLHGRIIGLNRETRQVILITPGFRYVSVVAVPEIPLDQLNLFDNVNMTFTRSVAFFVSPHANAPADAVAEAVARPVHGPGGRVVRVARISAMVVGVHPASHTVDVVNPSGGGVLTVHVHDSARTAALNSLKPGDIVTAVVAESLASSIQKVTGFGN